MEYQTYGDQFWKKQHKDARVLYSFKTRNGEILSVPSKHRYGRIDTVKERAVGSVTLADVMIARGPDTPRVLYTSQKRACHWKDQYDEATCSHGWCDYDDSCCDGRYFFIWKKGINVNLSRFKGYGLIVSPQYSCSFAPTADNYSWIIGHSPGMHSQVPWPHNASSPVGGNVWIYPIKNGQVNSNQELFLQLKLSQSIRALWKDLYGYCLGIDSSLESKCWSVRKPKFWVGC